ncbi:putative membrane protein (TIGR04086 family) [Natranaerovirga pectinivora]|uniref:Putative membrane protein (TIGR04086 family) n=1 Tax=Natranaerovirga pectinivora TaxID=682400 RepID=A0A4R3MU27_9FIRM|nr:TIGR04086 family membrane protein [Natranaerovirga pectinivora]TCT16776.1 putative membrane protein (TIGR04086 family) [Natranaerovirga pectinivora]
MHKSRSRVNVVERSKPLSVIKGVLWGYIFTAIMILLLTYLLFKFDITESQIYIGIVVTYIFSTIIAGWITGKSIKDNAWIWGSLAGFIYFILLIVGSVIINQQIGAVKEIFTMLALCVGGGTLGGMFS